MDALVLRDNPQVRPIYGDMRHITFAATTSAICYHVKATHSLMVPGAWRDVWYSDFGRFWKSIFDTFSEGYEAYKC